MYSKREEKTTKPYKLITKNRYFKRNTVLAGELMCTDGVKYRVKAINKAEMYSLVI